MKERTNYFECVIRTMKPFDREYVTYQDTHCNEGSCFIGFIIHIGKVFVEWKLYYFSHFINYHNVNIDSFHIN